MRLRKFIKRYRSLILFAFIATSTLVLMYSDSYIVSIAKAFEAPLNAKKLRDSRARVGDIPQEIQWTAQSLEDEYAWNTYFYGLHGGVVLESGAADGMLYSTTFAFESLSWQCVHIEVSPISFKELVKNRPSSTNIHAALCDSRRMVHLVDVPIGHIDVTAGIYEFMTQGFLEGFHPSLAHDPALVDQLPVVECLPLVPLLLERANFKSSLHVDFWVLDTEGSELAVLRTVDWDKISIDVIAIEVTSDAPPGKEQELEELLRSVGYIFDGAVLQNVWFRRSDFIPHRRPNSTSIST